MAHNVVHSLCHSWRVHGRLRDGRGMLRACAVSARTREPHVAAAGRMGRSAALGGLLPSAALRSPSQPFGAQEACDSAS